MRKNLIFYLDIFISCIAVYFWFSNLYYLIFIQQSLVDKIMTGRIVGEVIALYLPVRVLMKVGKPVMK